MVELNSVSRRPSPSESMDGPPPPEARATEGSAGAPTDERSRTLRFVAVSGRGALDRPAFESVLGVDERVRVLDTDLPPWRMVCALRMRGPNGSTALGTGWFVGPRTVITAGHCVYSTPFFGGWAESIEVIPGLNGTASAGADPSRPYGSVTSEHFSSIDRWTEEEEADFDIGCVHLAEPLGEQTGWFALASRPADDLQGYRVNISGYPADRGLGHEQYHAANRVVRVSERRVFYEVDTYGGQSGAPVWIHETPDAPPVAVAVHAYGVGGTPAGYGITANSAPRFIPEVYDTILGWIDADSGTA